MSTTVIYANYAKSGTSSYNSDYITLGYTASGSRGCLGFDISSVVNKQISNITLYLTQSSNIGSAQSIRFDFGSSNTWNTTSDDHPSITSTMASGSNRVRVWNIPSASIATIKSFGNTVYFHLRENGGTQVQYEGLTTGGSTAAPRIEVTYTESGSKITSIPSSVYSGTNFDVTFVPIGGAYTYQLVCRVGNNSSTNSIEASSASSITTQTKVWHSWLPTSTTETATVTLNTLSGNTVVGTDTKTVTVTVPDSVLPTAGELHSASINYAPIASWSSFIQGKSKAKLTLSGESGATAGTTIVSRTISGPGVSNATMTQGSQYYEYTTGYLNTAGSNTFTVTVTDSRGRTATTSVTFTVRTYSSPVITSQTAVRCTSTGQVDPNGTYAIVTVSWSVTDVGPGWNPATCTAAYRENGSSSAFAHQITLTNSGSSYLLGVSSDQMSIDKSYQILITLTDTITGSVTSIIDLPSANAYAIFIKKGGDGVSFGQYGATTGYLKSKFKIQALDDVEFKGKLLFPNNAANIPYWNLENSGVELTTGTDLNDILTVGNYYQSTDNIASAFTNKPASLTTGFGMKVFKSCGINNWLIQEITEAYYGTMWRRNLVLNGNGTLASAGTWCKYMALGTDITYDDPSKIPYWNMGAEGINIPANSDLNNMVAIGNYYCGVGADAQTLSHKPSSLSKGFCMKVYCSCGPTWWNWIIQEIIEYDGQTIFRRFVELYDSGTNKGQYKNGGTWYKFTGTAN